MFKRGFHVDPIVFEAVGQIFQSHEAHPTTLALKSSLNPQTYESD